MKTFKSLRRSGFFLVAVTLCILPLSECKKNNNNNNVNEAKNATSHICNDVTGVTAIYWDLLNGIPRTDIPGGVPTVKSIGGTYIHPSFPLLTFIYPAGYTPQTDPNSGFVGVNLIRNDNKAIWRYTSLFYSGSTTPQQVLNSEVTSLRTFLKSTGNISTLCSQQTSLPRATGISSNIASVLITFDNFTAALEVTITTESGLGAEQVNIVTTAAPTADFNNEVLNTFLAIDFQLLYKGDGEQDSDGDGYPDSVDAFPYDPTRH